MPLFRSLLVQFEIALTDYSAALTKLRDPSLSLEERLEVLASCDPLWERVEAIRRELDQLRIEPLSRD